MLLNQGFDGFLGFTADEAIYQLAVDIKTNVGDALHALRIRKTLGAVDIDFPDPAQGIGGHRSREPGRELFAWRAPVGVKIDNINPPRLADKSLEFRLANVLHGWSGLASCPAQHVAKLSPINALGAHLPHLFEFIDLVAHRIDVIAGRKQWEEQETEG